MNEEKLKLLVVAGREALATALRQWNYHATESRALDGHPVLGTTDEAECRIYNHGLATLKRLGAAADELEDAPLARKTAFDSTDWLGGASGEPQRQPSSVGWWWWVAVCWTPDGMKQLPTRVNVIERDGALWVGTTDCRDTEPTYERATLKAGWWFAEAVERSSAPPNGALTDGVEGPKL